MHGKRLGVQGAINSWQRERRESTRRKGVQQGEGWDRSWPGSSLRVKARARRRKAKARCKKRDGRHWSKWSIKFLRGDRTCVGAGVCDWRWTFGDIYGAYISGDELDCGNIALKPSGKWVQPLWENLYTARRHRAHLVPYHVSWDELPPYSLRRPLSSSVPPRQLTLPPFRERKTTLPSSTCTKPSQFSKKYCPSPLLPPLPPFFLNRLINKTPSSLAT